MCWGWGESFENLAVNASEYWLATWRIGIFRQQIPFGFPAGWGLASLVVLLGTTTSTYGAGHARRSAYLRYTYSGAWQPCCASKMAKVGAYQGREGLAWLNGSFIRSICLVTVQRHEIYVIELRL